MPLSHLKTKDIDKHVETALGILSEDLLELMATGKYSITIDGQTGLDVLRLLESLLRRAVTLDAKGEDRLLINACALLMASAMESQAARSHINLSMQTFKETDS